MFDPPGRNLLCAVAKCYIITLVPFRSVGLSANGGSGEGSPEVEVVSDSRLDNLLQSPQVHSDQDELNQVDLDLGLQSEAQIGDIGSGDFSLPDELDPAGRLGDFRSSFGFDESVRGTSVFEEPQQLDEPVTSSSNSSRVVHHNFLSNVKLYDIEMPWEQGVTKFVFGDELLPSESLAAQPMWPTSSLVVEARSHDDVATGLDTLLKAAGEVHHSSCFFSAGSNLADVRYVDKKKLELESACTKWISILKLCHGASSVSEHIFMDDSDESLNSNMEVVEAIIGVRSAATAISRANVFRKLLAWVIGNFPESSQTLDEHKVWKYFNHLRLSGAAPMAASSALSSLRYAQHIFGFSDSGLADVTNSRRLVGSSEIMFSLKDPVRQAVVLKVQEVLTLHSKLHDVNANLFDQIGAGYLLLCLYGRCRHSDFVNVSHVTHDHNESWGFWSLHKVPQDGKGPGQESHFPANLGAGHWDWWSELGIHALELRGKCGLKFHDKVEGPILRPPTSASSEVLCQRSLTSGECGRFLRAMLGMSLERPGKGVLGVTSHSLKATGLSWASKYGLGKYDRAVLGWHSSTTSSASAIYARDLAYPSVKKFQELLFAIKDKTFRPDAPRSLYFERKAVAGTEDETFEVDKVKPKVEDRIEVKDDSVVVPSSVEVESVFSSDSSDSDSASDEDSAGEDEDFDEFSQPRKFRRVSGPEAEGPTWMFHRRSGVLHLCDPAADSSQLRKKYFRCGRLVGNNHCPMTDKESGNPMCTVCNRRSWVWKRISLWFAFLRFAEVTGSVVGWSELRFFSTNMCSHVLWVSDVDFSARLSLSQT